MLTSKLFAPASLGLISIGVSIGLFASVRAVEPVVAAFLCLGIVGFYIGHLLYAASLDFTSHQDHFVDHNFASDSEKRVLIIGVAVCLLAGVFYYYFMWLAILRRDGIQLSFAKFVAYGAPIAILSMLSAIGCLALSLSYFA
jgi:hypothetical protein